MPLRPPIAPQPSIHAAPPVREAVMNPLGHVGPPDPGWMVLGPQFPSHLGPRRCAIVYITLSNFQGRMKFDGGVDDFYFGENNTNKLKSVLTTLTSIPWGRADIPSWAKVFR